MRIEVIDVEQYNSDRIRYKYNTGKSGPKVKKDCRDLVIPKP